MAYKINDRNAKGLILEGYLRMGWALIPLKPKGKEPLTDLLPERNGRRTWKPFADRPPTEPELWSWLERYPDMNIGIITGEPSGLVVVDIDRPDLVDIDPELPTPRVKTGRGIHLYFTADEDPGIKTIETPDGNEVGEVRGSGGYVVAPPSTHPEGDPYRWDEYRNPDRFEPPPFSAWSRSFLLNDTRNSISCVIGLLGMTERPGSRAVSSSTNPLPTVNAGDADMPEFEALAREFVVARDVMGEAGVVVGTLGRAFRCPFHDEDRPSAALWRPEGGYIGYHDFHRRGGHKWYTLADVYCAAVTGTELQRLTGGVGVVWWLRALHELEYISDLPTLVCRKLPKSWNSEHYEYEMDDATHIVKRENVEAVYNGLQYLLRLRSIYDPNQRGTPFSWRFGATWCGVSINTVQKAMRFLMQTGLVYVMDERAQNQANILDVRRCKDAPEDDGRVGERSSDHEQR